MNQYFILFKNIFNSEIIIEPQEVAEIVYIERDIFTDFLLMVTSYLTKVRYQNQELKLLYVCIILSHV